MAYDLVKQIHPGAPCAVGARVRDAGGRLGSIVPQRPGLRGVAVRFDGLFRVVDCPPGELAYAEPPTAFVQPWCAR